MKPTTSERRTAVWMLILTSLYLTVELGFNARLLDVVGGTASADEIHHIEIYGRWISGAALTLFAWSVIFKKAFASGERLPVMLIKLLLAAAACCAVMYGLQEAIIRSVVATSSGESRARAAVLVPVTHILTKEDVALTGLEVTAADYQTPEGKSFLATFALQALAVPDLGDKMRKIADPVFGFVAQEARGGLAGAYDAYQESQKIIEKQYETDYLNGNRSYESAIGTTPARQREAWADYENSLRKQRWTPSTVPAFHTGRVRSSVQKKVPVPNNWRPSDQATFYAAVANRVQREALNEFSSKSGGLMPNLSLSQFMASNNIQGKWRTALKIPSFVALVPGQSQVQFGALTYEAIIAADLKRLKFERLAEPKAYTDGAQFSVVGRDSIRALAVPPIALFFSLLGAFTHLFKCLLWTGKVFFAWPSRFVLMALALYAILVFSVPLSLTNRFTEQTLYKKLEKDTRERMPAGIGQVVSSMVRWSIQMQHYFYPVNEAVRIHVLQGMNFGYRDTPATFEMKAR